MLIRRERAVNLILVITTSTWLGCGPPRHQDLSYTSNLWRVYDSRPRFLLLGERALPRGPLEGLIPRSWGVWVLGRQDIGALVSGNSPTRFLIDKNSYDQIYSCGANLMVRRGARWLILSQESPRQIEWPRGALPLRAVSGGQEAYAAGSNGRLYRIHADGRVSDLARLETTGGIFLEQARQTVAVFSKTKSWIYSHGKKALSLRIPTSHSQILAAVLPGQGLALADGRTLHLYLRKEGRGRWSRRLMSMYIEGAEKILDIESFGDSLAVLTEKGVALSRSAPYQLWHVLDTRTGLPKGRPVALVWAAKNLWLLYEDKVCRTESVVWEQMGLR